MAKVGFTKLGLKPNNDIKVIQFNEQDIEVKQYLPVDKKLELIAKVIELSHDDNNFSNPVKVSVYLLLNVIDFYTNINFTEKQREDPPKIYDLIIGSGLDQEIIKVIPYDEYRALVEGLEKTIEAFYKYRNSVLGILETIGQDYSNLDLDAQKIQQKLADPENMALLKDVLTKLG